MSLTEFVRKSSEPLQRAFFLSEHPSGLMADGVDQKVRMNMRLVDVRRDQHLAVRPGLSRKLLCQFVCLLWSDVLIRMEGLRVVVKPDWAFLVV